MNNLVKQLIQKQMTGSVPTVDRGVKVAGLPFDGMGFYPPLESGGARFIHVDVRDSSSHVAYKNL